MMGDHLRDYGNAFVAMRRGCSVDDRNVDIVKERVVRNILPAINAFFSLLPCRKDEALQSPQASLPKRLERFAIGGRARSV